MIPSGVNDNIAFLVGRLSDLQYKAVSRLFRELQSSVTIEQFSVLTVLFYEEGIRQQDIAIRLNRDKTTVARVLNNMIKRNLIVKVPGKDDKRTYGIYLTHLGKEMQNKLVQETGKVYMAVIHKISRENMATTIQTLNQMIQNMKDF